MQRHTPLGYQIVDGKAEIAPESAQIVRAVYEEYLAGTSTYRIAKGLTEKGILNASRKPSWNHGSVGKILENAKYIGDGFYPLLIDKAIFEQVQRMRQKKVESLGRTAKLNSFANASLFSNKLYCGACGQPYRRYVEHCGQAGETVKWKCKHYIWGNRVCCRNIFLTNEQIENAFLRIINKGIATPIILERQSRVKSLASCPASERLTGQIQQALETGQYTASQLKEMVFERAIEQYQVAVIDDWSYQTDKLKAALSGKEAQTTFDGELFTATIKKAIIYEDGRMQFYLHNDLMLETHITEKAKEADT